MKFETKKLKRMNTEQKIENDALEKYPICMVQGENGFGHEVDENQYERLAYIAGRSKGIEENLLSFCHWIGKKGYKINGYDDSQLITIINQFKADNNF